MTAFDSIDPDEAENYKTILESSGCQVVLLSGGSASSADPIGSKEYSKYCNTTGELAILIPKSEMGTLLEILERSAASGDDYAVYLLSLYHERMSNVDKALEYAEKAILSSDKSVALRGRLQKASIEKDEDSLHELVGKGDATFNECVEFYKWLSDEDADLTAIEGFSDSTHSSLARLSYSITLIGEGVSDVAEGNYDTLDEADSILTKVVGKEKIIADCFRAYIACTHDNWSSASTMLSNALPELKQYDFPFPIVFYLDGLYYLHSCDYKMAFDTFLEGAQRNVEVCQRELGGMLLMGKGCTQDIDKAIEWLEKAEANGDEDARSLLYKARTIKRKGPSCKVSSWSFTSNYDYTKFEVSLNVAVNNMPQDAMFTIALCETGDDISEAFDVIMFNSASSSRSYHGGMYKCQKTYDPNENRGGDSPVRDGSISVDAYVFLMDYINPIKEGWKTGIGTINETLSSSDLIDCFSFTLNHKSFAFKDDEWRID